MREERVKEEEKGRHAWLPLYPELYPFPAHVGARPSRDPLGGKIINFLRHKIFYVLLVVIEVCSSVKLIVCIKIQ